MITCSWIWHIETS